jgi:hypothetical protein
MKKVKVLRDVLSLRCGLSMDFTLQARLLKITARVLYSNDSNYTRREREREREVFLG